LTDRVTTSPSEAAESLSPAVRSYPLHIGGEDFAGAGWVYTVTSRSLLEDVFTSIRLKRTLEQDDNAAAAQHPYVVGRCAVAADDDIDRATSAAATAFPKWAKVSLERRLSLGASFRDKLRENYDDLLELMVAEAHPIALARWEIESTLNVFSKESCDVYGQGMHTEYELGDRKLIVRRQPDGVVCFNPPQNAPAPIAALAVLVLMAGNSVVVRAPRSVALSSMYLLRELVLPLLSELDAPPGTLNIICSNPGQTMRRWLTSPLVNDIFFTGGVEEGMRFQQECVSNNKKPILELAGNDGLVVWEDADLDLAAEAIAEAFYGSGQICMLPNYVLAHPAIADELLERVVAQASLVRPGYADDEGAMLSPVRRTERFFVLLEQAMDHGAKLVCGGKRTDMDGTPSDTGVFVQPTVVRVDGLADARKYDMVREETFFPMLPVIVPEQLPDDELIDGFIDFLNANEYGLRNSLWARSDRVVDAFVGQTRNGGMFKVNDSHMGILPVLAGHGGTGLTGGVFGEANYPIFKTSHLQGVSIGRGISPRGEILGKQHKGESRDRNL